MSLLSWPETTKCRRSTAKSVHIPKPGPGLHKLQTRMASDMASLQAPVLSPAWPACQAETGKDVAKGSNSPRAVRHCPLSSFAWDLLCALGQSVPSFSGPISHQPAEKDGLRKHQGLTFMGVGDKDKAFIYS